MIRVDHNRTTTDCNRKFFSLWNPSHRLENTVIALWSLLLIFVNIQPNAVEFDWGHFLYISFINMNRHFDMNEIKKTRIRFKHSSDALCLVGPIVMTFVGAIVNLLVFSLRIPLTEHFLFHVGTQMRWKTISFKVWNRCFSAFYYLLPQVICHACAMHLNSEWHSTSTNNIASRRSIGKKIDSNKSSWMLTVTE